LQAYLKECYCISISPCPDSRWGSSVPPTKYLGERCSLGGTVFPIHYTTAMYSGNRNLFFIFAAGSMWQKNYAF